MLLALIVTTAKLAYNKQRSNCKQINKLQGVGKEVWYLASSRIGNVMTKTRKEVLEEHQHKLERELELAHELAKMGLHKGAMEVITVISAVLLSLICALVGLIVTGKQLLGDWAIVAIVGIIAAAFVIYFGFVFGRIVIIKFKISDTEKQIEVEAGKKT